MRQDILFYICMKHCAFHQDTASALLILYHEMVQDDPGHVNEDVASVTMALTL